MHSGAHWDNLHVGALPLSTAATAVLAGLGLVLFLRDTIPFLTDRIRTPPHDDVLPPSHPAVARLQAVIRELPPVALEPTLDPPLVAAPPDA